MSLIIILALSSGITSYVNKYFSQDETNEILTITSDSNISYSTIKEISNIDGVTNVLSSYRLNSVKYTNSKIEDTYTINYTYSTDTKNQPDVLYGNMPTNLGEVAIDIDIAESIYTDTSIIAAINDTIDLTYNNLTYTFKIVGIYDDGLDIKSSYISEDSLYVFNNLYQTTYDAISGYYYNICYVKVKNITYLNSVSNSIRGISSSLTITTTNQESETILDYIDLATKVLTVLSLLSLSVAAIMIIIVQYVSIVERTKEIGILRSIGGRRKDILYLFLFESLILGSLGGTLAVSVSYLLAGITNIICYISTKCIFISFNPIWYLIGFMVSVLVSILAGITPARKASSLDPITCLRSE
jgi:ABC-type antimicrobial peptide transport system permease subunit